jgi:anti-anti-sigma factor
MPRPLKSRQAKWLQETDNLHLTGEVDFSNVADLLQEGNHWLQHTGQTQCNLSLAGVTYTNSAGVALIMGLRRTADELNKHFIIRDVPANLLSMTHLGGLDWLLVSNAAPPHSAAPFTQQQ